MALAHEKNYIIDDIYALPEGERAELIDGKIYYMTLPSRTQQTIARELFSSIHSYIKSNDGSCEPFFAPFAVFLNENNKNYVEPDTCYNIYPGFFINLSALNIQPESKIT